MTPDIFATLLHLAATLYVTIHSIHLVGKHRNSTMTVFFTFGTFSLLLSAFYWITYDIMKPGIRMPFAGNEIGECAGFLLLAEALASVFRLSSADTKKEVIGTALFCAASVALWIAWSGEWVQDILSGLAFGYLLCTVASAVKKSGALSKRAWRFGSFSAALLIAVQVSIFFVPEPLKHPLDLFCYALMFCVSTYITLRYILAVRSGENSKTVLSLAFCGFGWVISSMYMSTGIFYTIFLFGLAAYLPIMLYAVRKEVGEA